MRISGSVACNNDDDDDDEQGKPKTLAGSKPICGDEDDEDDGDDDGLSQSSAVYGLKSSEDAEDDCKTRPLVNPDSPREDMEKFFKISQSIRKWGQKK